jgi:alpha-methylacyl-CoA racemase
VTPLAGKRILDLSRYAPGSYATLICASLGADVIKLEAPHAGDPLRELDAAAFERLNRGKRSLVLDLKAPAAAARFRRLLPTADVIVENFRPGVMMRFGLDFESVARLAPAIVYVSISGYGQRGPFAHRAGHDINYMASAGGLAGVDAPLPLQVADFAAGGLNAVIAILAALMEGGGRFIDLSMHEAVLSLSMLDDGRARDILSGRYPNYTVYPTRDGGGLSVGALEQKFWKAFCDVIERPDFVERRGELGIRSDVASIIASQPRAHWQERFRGVDACVEPVHTLTEAAHHPQARHRGFTPAAFQLPFGLAQGVADGELGRAPTLGEHSDEILGPLG